MPLLMCQKCKGTYIEDEAASPTCSRCGVALVEVCEWCNQPEKQCRCGKEDINVE